MVAATLETAQARSGYFYFWMAVACAVVAFGGFAGTYWLQVPAGTFIGPPLLHLHAAVFSGWVVLLLSQTWLAAHDRLEHHRAWGLAGVSLGTLIVAVGIAAAMETLDHGLAAGYGDKVRSFLVVPLSAIVLFVGFFVGAIANINRPDWHKRLMLASTAALLQAAVARIPFLITTGGGPGARPGLAPPPPVQAAFVGAVAVSLLLGAGVIYDWRTRGRPHPAYLIAIAAILAVGLVRDPISATPQWLAFADWVHSFAG